MREKNGFEDGDPVNNGKLILFQEEEVLTHELRPCPQKQSCTGLDGEEATQTLSASSIEGNVSSLKSLWKMQYATQPTGGSIPAPARSLG